MFKITNTFNRTGYGYDTWMFPGGEVGVKLHNNTITEFTDSYCCEIIARITEPKQFFELVMLQDALIRIGVKNIELVLPYVPYARQDRVCDKGESFSLRMFAHLIATLYFSKGTVFDIHSSVGEAIFDVATFISQLDIIDKWPEFKSRLCYPIGKQVFLSVDAGSNKKVAKLAAHFNHKEFIRADKLRDLSTGKIIETVVYADDLHGKNAVIVDDCGDGCATFIELAKVLRARNVGKIILYVTHGIFSKGLDVVFEHVDEVWTTNSFHESYDSRVRVFDIEALL